MIANRKVTRALLALNLAQIATPALNRIRIKVSTGGNVLITTRLPSGGLVIKSYSMRSVVQPRCKVLHSLSGHVTY